jgi:hypothetical protein
MIVVMCVSVCERLEAFASVEYQLAMAKKDAVESASERTPVVHNLSIGWKQGLRTKLEVKGVVARVIERLLKPRRKWRRDLVVAVAKEMWPPAGEPPPNMTTPDAERKLGDECENRGIIASPDTLKRAMNRR